MKKQDKTTDASTPPTPDPQPTQPTTAADDAPTTTTAPTHNPSASSTTTASTTTSTISGSNTTKPETTTTTTTNSVGCSDTDTVDSSHLPPSNPSSQILGVAAAAVAPSGKGTVSSSSSTPSITVRKPAGGSTGAKPSPSVVMGMKHSKSDHSSLGRKTDKSSSKEKKGGTMGKKFISKSHENLSNGKKGVGGSASSRATTPQQQPLPTSTTTTTPSVESSPRRQPKPSSSSSSLSSLSRPEPASERNKENQHQALKERGKNTAPSDSEIFAKPRPVKSSGGGVIMKSNLRKASSTQSIDKSSQGSLGHSNLKSNSSSKSSNSSIKRAQSTQNISKDKFTKKRTSAPADVMAYNAELLANFEKEKKLLEIRMSELTKVAEGRKEEIEKYKYEVKRLRTTISQSVPDKEELEVLKSQNKQLNDRLHELGFPAEQITDSEKLLLKQSAAIASGGAAATTTVSASSISSHQTDTYIDSQGKYHPDSTCSDTCLPTSVSCDSLSTDGGGGGGSIVIGRSRDYKDMIHRSNSVSTSEPGCLALLGGEGEEEEGEYCCSTPDHPSILSLDNASVHWDKQSTKSANSDGGNSEVSVACLTERILQMEETNYSTTEELQATLQELGDLQDAVNELTEDNGSLVDEKSVLLESLCTQTEKLEKTRVQLEQLKCLLISGELPEKSEMDGHLRGLLKSAQEEREELMRKQAEWCNAMEGLETDCKEAQEAGETLRDKFTLVEAANKTLKASRDTAEAQLAQMREDLEAERIEVVRLKTSLETEKKKVLELESARMAQDKTDVETLLDAARRDKAQVEDKLADANERIARSQCEVTRVKDIVSSKDQELIAWRASSYEERGKLEYELEEAAKERRTLMTEIEALRTHVVQLEEECDRLGEEKSGMSTKFQELQTEFKNCLQHKLVQDAEMQEMRSKHDTESEEWRQFQKDLQTAVVIANNFSQETKKTMETLTEDKTSLEDQVSSLYGQLERLKEELATAQQQAVAQKESTARKFPIMTNAELKGKVGKVLGAVDRGDVVVLGRDGLRTTTTTTTTTTTSLDQRSQSISVKSLIRTIEEKVKSGCSSKGQSSQSESRRSSTSSDISLASLKELVNSVSSPQLVATPESPHSPSKDFAFRAASLRVAPATPTTASSMKRERERSPQSTRTSSLTTASSNPGQSDSTVATSKNSNGVICSSGGGGSTPTNRMEGGVDCHGGKVSYPISSILKDRSTPRRNSGTLEMDLKKESPGKDPLASLAKQMKGSKRNSLLKWCQAKTLHYSNIDITNFSSSWNDGLAFCALLHSYAPHKIPYHELTSEDKRRNFSLAFKVGEGMDIQTNLNINDMVCMERPDWQAVMSYVTAIYKHFEVDRQ